MAVLKYKDPTTGKFVELPTGSTEIIDNLDSTSKTSALSANQGRILNNQDKVLTDRIKNQSITGDVSGNATVNTTDNTVKFTVKRRGACVGQTTDAITNPWYKFADISTTNAYFDFNIMFSVYAGYNDSSDLMGILMAHFRTTDKGAWASGEMKWLIKTTFLNVDDFVIAHNTTSPCKAELWCKCPRSWQGYHFDVISEGDRTGRYQLWNLYNTWTRGGADTPTSGYIQVKSTVVKQYLNINTRNTTDTWIPVYKSGELQYTTRVLATSKTHTNYGTEQDRLPTLSFLSYWNGAYNSSNNSNLTYAHQGTIQCKPKTLYDNSSGTTGTVTLNETAANFSYLEIFFSKSEGNNLYRNSTKVYSPNGKIVNLIIAYNIGNAGLLQLQPKCVSISGTTVSNTSNTTGYVNLYNGRSVEWGNNNEIKIHRILGYR